MRRKHKNWADFKPVLNSPWRASPSTFSGRPERNAGVVHTEHPGAHDKAQQNEKEVIRKDRAGKEKKNKENQHNCSRA